MKNPDKPKKGLVGDNETIENSEDKKESQKINSSLSNFLSNILSNSYKKNGNFNNIYL